MGRIIWLGVLLIVVLLLAWSRVLQAAGDFLTVSDPLRRVDAIITVSGNNPERVRTASGLMRDGYGQWLIVSGAPRPASEMAAMARAAGVPAARILIDPSATSTWQNARGSARVMRASGLRTASVMVRSSGTLRP